MPIFMVYLKKELHERKWYMLGMILLLPAVFSMMDFFFYNHIASRAAEDMGRFAFACLVVSVCVFGIDLFGGEIRRGGYAFLNRLPHGLITVFFAKTAALFILTLSVVTCCLLIGFAIHALSLWHFTPLKHMVHPNFMLFYSLCGNEISELITMDWPLISLFLSSTFAMVAISCWTKRLGWALVISIVHAGFFYQLYKLLVDVPMLDDLFIHLFIPNLCFFVLYPFATFLLAFGAFIQPNWNPFQHQRRDCHERTEHVVC